MSKDVLLRLPEDLADAIDQRAELIGDSRNAWLVKALTWAVSQPVTTRTTTERV